MEGSVIEKVRLNLNLPNNSEKQQKVSVFLHNLNFKWISIWITSWSTECK